MAIELISKIKPKNNGTFPLMDAADVEMPDGTRLSDFKGGVTSVNGQTGDVTITVTNGKDGQDGQDGVSPSVSVSSITGGHRVTITDATGTKTFDVMDGEDGSGASIIVDTTLSQEGQAADAAVVGAAFNEYFQMAQSLLPKLLPDVTAEDEGKILQVVGGAWAKVAVADSQVKTYVDEYINSALGGEY